MWEGKRMTTDYEYLAYSLATLAGLPVRLYRNDVFAGLWHHTKFKPDLAILEEKSIFRNEGNVSYYMDENFLYYGLLRMASGNAALLIGPVTQSAVSHAAAIRILRHIGESGKRADELRDYFSAMPSYPLRNFLQILCTVNYFINGEKTDVSQLLLDGTELPERNSLISREVRDAKKAETVHNTMELEELLLSHVEYGKVEELEKLYQQPTAGRAGTMAGDTLRQQKNLLICTATLVTRAAMKGGLDRETAFSLSDHYIQQAELTEDYLALTRLNAQMVLDFTRRVNAAKSGIYASGLIRDAKNYILAHMDEPVTTEALSRHLGMNRTYLCKQFAEEAGLTVNQYVTKVKLEEAKRLLHITQKPIGEIAQYLGYSSQSYFQKVFKTHTGITPAEYRKKA